jgi:hypothetical protein
VCAVGMLHTRRRHDRAEGSISDEPQAGPRAPSTLAQVFRTDHAQHTKEPREGEDEAPPGEVTR